MIIVQNRISHPNLKAPILESALLTLFLNTISCMTSYRLVTSSRHFRAQEAFGPTPLCGQEPSACPASIGGGRVFALTQPGPIAEIGNCHGPSPFLPFDGFHNLKIYASIFHK